MAFTLPSIPTTNPRLWELLKPEIEGTLSSLGKIAELLEDPAVHTSVITRAISSCPHYIHLVKTGIWALIDSDQRIYRERIDAIEVRIRKALEVQSQLLEGKLPIQEWV